MLYNISVKKEFSMFFGIYFHQLDDKGRIRLPSKLRAELGGSFYCMKGFDNTILVYSEERFNKFCQSVVDMPLDKVESQRALTEIISYAFKIEEDSQGRFILPVSLREKAEIEKNVVIKGVIDRIEIWSEKAHLERNTDKSFNELIRTIGDKDN